MDRVCDRRPFGIERRVFRFVPILNAVSVFVGILRSRAAFSVIPAVERISFFFEIGRENERGIVGNVLRYSVHFPAGGRRIRSAEVHIERRAGITRTVAVGTDVNDVACVGAETYARIGGVRNVTVRPDGFSLRYVIDVQIGRVTGRRRTVFVIHIIRPVRQRRKVSVDVRR